MKRALVLQRLALGLGTFLIPVVLIASCAKEEPSGRTTSTPTPTSAVETVATATPTVEPTPTPTPTRTTASTQSNTFTFENEFISFDYGTEWRTSGETDSSIVLTHKEKPGDVLLSVQWVEGQVSDTAGVAQLFKDQLELLATDVQTLMDIKIGSIDAKRYASMVSRDDGRAVVSLNVLFNSGNTFYLVTFSADPDDFVTYEAHANRVINTLRIP